MSVTLETELDRQREEKVITRIAETSNVSAYRLPTFSVADYLIVAKGQINTFVELKIRKQTEKEVRNYGGVMLKHSKLLKLQTLRDLTCTRVWIVFAFAKGEGAMYWVDVSKLTDLQPEKPPARRNFRGLPTDDEEVVYLDWLKDLNKWPVALS